MAPFSDKRFRLNKAAPMRATPGRQVDASEGMLHELDELTEN